MSAQSGRPKWLTLLLVLAPLWLVVSAGYAIFHRITTESAEEQRPRNQFTRAISASELGDDLRKITTWIGERHHAGDTPAKNLTRTAAWIEGLLGPSNTGYVIEKKQAPLDWPILTANLPGKNPDKPPVWIVCTYDSKAGSIGIEENATGLVATIAAARALAGSEMNGNVHFAFVPHFNNPSSPRAKTAALLKNVISQKSLPKAVLCIEAMGAQTALQASSPDSAMLANLPLHDIASAVETNPAEIAASKDLSTLLFEIGLPAARIATRPPLANEEPDNLMPNESTLTQAAVHLTELIKRCVNSR